MDGEARKKILLIDGHGLAFRAFYALPEMNAPDGTPTNAVLGSMNMLLKAEADLAPDKTVVFFDPHGPTVRDAMFDKYKAHRQPAPDVFKVQMPLIIELMGLLGYPTVIRDGMEADDVIASTASSICCDHDVLILTADKDLMQILRPGIAMIRPTKGISEFKTWTDDSFRSEYGFEPSSMADYLALVGDTADNVPGVSGIGDKTARSLLSTYGTLRGIYKSLDDLPKGTASKLDKGRDAAELSLSLVVPQQTDPVDVFGAACVRDLAAASALCSRLGLKKLIERLRLDDASTGAASTVVAAMNQIGPLREISLDDIRKDEAIAIQHGEICVVMNKKGEWARASLDAAEHIILDGDREIIASDLRAAARVIPSIYDVRKNVFDVSLAHYYFHPDAKSHVLRSVEEDRPPEEICSEMISAHDGYIADPAKEDMMRVMRDIDIPLCPVLDELSDAGIGVDVQRMRDMKSDLEKRVIALEAEIREVAGWDINLNSPKQVGELLFERLHLPVIKKTKTGYSTDASVLDELSALPSPLNKVPRMMIEFRESAKVLTGFVEPFIKYAESSKDGRVRSTFRHDVTGTGRLASRDPNVQNMPAFGEWAERFRSAIRPSDGMMFVAADYSQIELRVLAHLSGESRLIEAFSTGRDVHRETASWVFSVSPEDVTPEQRRFAKTVNFGLIYGMSAHGLAARMGIQRHQAASLIDTYFSVLPSVRSYLERSAMDARAAGRTRSIFGRIRPLAEAGASEGRGAVDRIAVNTPIQSAASDIAKIAMVNFRDVLKREMPSARLVLQVHDSLVCEAPYDRSEHVERLLVDTMESIKAIDVPLTAEAKRGISLAEI